MTEVELEFMPRARRWRVLINGKAFPRRFSDRASALKELERQKDKVAAPTEGEEAKDE